MCRQSSELNLNRLYFNAGRTKAALLFWSFGDFRCGALLFIYFIFIIFFFAILFIQKYKNR